MPLPPELRAQMGRGWAEATAANVARGVANKRKVLAGTLAGMSLNEIAQATGLHRDAVREYRRALRRTGELGCCMHNGCLQSITKHQAKDREFTACPHYVA